VAPARPGQPLPAAGPRPRPAGLTGADPAAVFFTSGSTGEPKGAVCPHSGTVRLFRDCPFADYGPGQVIAMASAVPWDVLGLEVWSVLLNGGCSVVVEEPYLLPATLRALVAAHGVNSLFLTPTLFNLFVTEDLGAFEGIDQVMLGGEKVSPRHLRTFRERFPQSRLLHGYGPVESSIATTMHLVGPGDTELAEGVPLGDPVPGTGLHIRNDAGACAPGEIGELLISGTGLALGYLGDPERTARSFRTHLIEGQEVRVYHTGDLVHRTADGRLHFDGRADRQVKIRGHRIEPGEIEHAVQAVPGVGGSAVVPVPDPAGGFGALVLAYTGGAQAPSAEQLLVELRATLPAHLVPGRAVRLDALPLNGNGKLDQAAVLRLAAAAAPPAPAARASA
ncbi:AMP-binding protein, partial [Kitasatospora sp. LaBMicrA B282]|uniref:AMP-binding protein n=1 Tax=Kitasatospora sp. LaBMicrA B282 TaxID=3420949 RepID=UPI003D0A5C46